jgi:hypothetical protein
MPLLLLYVSQCLSYDVFFLISYFIHNEAATFVCSHNVTTDLT